MDSFLRLAKRQTLRPNQSEETFPRKFEEEKENYLKKRMSQKKENRRRSSVKEATIHRESQQKFHLKKTQRVMNQQKKVKIRNNKS